MHSHDDVVLDLLRFLARAGTCRSKPRVYDGGFLLESDACDLVLYAVEVGSQLEVGADHTGEHDVNLSDVDARA